ncbi:peptide-methionine (S)-S-oxide reductase MsrA [Tuanshanicoccus lijuaniae]|uniref:peptide-methionine (S)-S-oxide reductase MsrA n=1 Tax=Aerococcaceae bacterium zg-1292 TaxID=2774330 RepID=UPI001935E2D3|nr:peptide-methionine (S)-S-oxide reductase MsrA [Aerococcaceae bacterium zg-1292]MBF6625368.1 peptide-methionine (S)-S-oxide reductase MsrA [Aerococcaceae bacterium zg-BR9]MBS4456401.1 peptide-methionine (S)-S-oxide reductase MsrA [Aerococcaceae bacterium zg-A91]MBS4458183.1 peptide-methionine (S)-S-oxide reductase MsrA [Aerococcaceae bacterium zg-BR33]QQA37209.1 peptide-methionine (S)-S-oxide reductase MsrA [Aerococcaceae bacterium zg-1292]
MEKKEQAIFAGGCFWCMVHPFDKWEGVESVISGYIGGTTENPTYEQVKTGMTGHAEAVCITFNPDVVSYDQLLKVFWQIIDPTDSQGQFVDRGTSYRPEIFYTNEAQKRAAEQSKEALEKSGMFNQPIVVPITPAPTFYEAETYHQDFYLKNPEHYERYRSLSGRDEFIQRHHSLS